MTSNALMAASPPRRLLSVLARPVAVACVCLLAVGCGGGSSPPQPPSIGATSFSTKENQSLSASLQLRDPQGESLVAAVTAPPSHGSLSAVDGGGGFTYQPNHLFYGSDTFSVSVTDASGASATGVITITVNQVNLQPVVSLASFSTNEDQSSSGNLGLTDPQAESLQVTVSALPTHGTLTGPDGTGQFTYSPSLHFYGTDSFAVSIVDTDGLTTAATVSLMVKRVDYQPVAAPDQARTAPGIPVTVKVLANDSDANPDALSAVIVGASSNGTAAVNTDGSITFLPTVGFAGTTSLTYS
ncbi:MAG TPA: Ig-like domain-containing protein, partial [Steroidobacteraceae bacterium]|nr:Ig-like domain-containing protein [Steroidobacteraceae bacterium]